MSKEEFQGFLKGNVIKYLARRKGGGEDLEKAKHYLEKLIEVVGVEEGKSEVFQPRSLCDLVREYNDWVNECQLSTGKRVGAEIDPGFGRPVTSRGDV